MRYVYFTPSINLLCRVPWYADTAVRFNIYVYVYVCLFFSCCVPFGGNTQDSMSAAFGAGDMTSSAGANSNNAGGGGGNSAANVGEILGNTISLDEIMRASKTNVR